MQGVILLNANANTKIIEEEEKGNFIKNILDSLGLPLQDIWDYQTELTIENKIKLRSILATYNVQIIEDHNGEAIIYCDAEIIGHWRKPTYVLKKDGSQLDPKKRLYLAMNINTWSILDNTPNE